MSGQDLEQRARELLPELPPCADAIAIAAWGPKPDYYTADQMRDYAIRAIVAALRAAPDGYVLVPVEPTDEMCAAAFARIKEVTVVIDAGPAKGATLVRDPYYHAYKAMLAARPQGVQS